MDRELVVQCQFPSEIRQLKLSEFYFSVYGLASGYKRKRSTVASAVTKQKIWVIFTITASRIAIDIQIATSCLICMHRSDDGNGAQLEFDVARQKRVETMPNTITIKNLKHIKSLIFEVPPPGVHLLSGANGAGKTSVLAVEFRRNLTHLAQ